MAHLSYYNHVKDLNAMFYDSHVSLIEKICLELQCPDKKDILIEKLLDSGHKLKPKKDSDAPKKWRSNFILFSDEKRKEVMLKDPNLKLGGVAKELGKMWKSTPEKTKEKYNHLSQKDKERYESELEEYNNKLHLSSLLQYDN